MRKLLFWLIIISGGIVFYNLDAITGQWKFDKLCKNEGGSKFYAKIDQYVGWEVESQDEHAYKDPFHFGHVAFVRFRNKQGDSFDVRIKNGPNQWSKSYDLLPADNKNTIKYRLNIEQSLLPDDKRFSRTRFTITDVQLGSPVATHTYFSYMWTKPERVFLNAPTSVSCHSGSDVDSFYAAVRQSERKQ